MKGNNYLYSILGVILAVGDAAAGLRVSNISRNSYGASKGNQTYSQQYYDTIYNVEQDVPVTVDLPVAVADKDLAEQIRSGDENAATDMETLNRCATIYPDGNFIWDKPTIGRGAGGPATCVSVVEMRAIKASANSEHTVVARGKLAAGDSISCNISDFPASTYLPDIANIIFPADAKPTREDVIRVLNEEQKNNAGLKIAAAALIGGIGGNIVGKNEIGQDSLMGTNSDKMKTTAIGAVGGAALMAASSYSGKVAGDIILHSGVNAAAGGVIGNMVASGDSVMRIEKCVDEGVETSCLWGIIQKKSNLPTDSAVYATINGDSIIYCESDTTKCKVDNSLILTQVAGVDVSAKPDKKEQARDESIKYSFDSRKQEITDNVIGDSAVYYKASAYKRDGAPIPAVIVGIQDSAFGVKGDDFKQWKAVNGKTAKICRRDSKGNPYGCTKDDGTPAYTIQEFTESKLDADDGGVIDFSNKARLGTTLKGAGIGGAIGGFSGYQGAQADIEERLNQALREYNASLEKIYCGTGNKWLGFYNDDVIIPAMKN